MGVLNKTYEKKIYLAKIIIETQNTFCLKLRIHSV